MERNKAVLPLLIVGLLAVLGCSKLSQLANSESNSRTDEPRPTGDISRSFSLAGKEWSSNELKDTDIKVDLPGTPADKTPPLPPSYKQVFSAMHIYSYDDKDFASSYTEMVPTGKRKFTIKELADTSMAAMKKQLPDLTYTLDVKSDSNAKYNGSFTKNGKSFDVRGCCIYKKDGSARVWAVLTLIPKDNSDAQTAGQRIIDSVSFKNSTEACK